MLTQYGINITARIEEIVLSKSCLNVLIDYGLDEIFNYFNQ